jgi:hypothetical protein
MTSSVFFDAAGRRRSPAMLPTVQGTPATAKLGFAPTPGEDLGNGSSDTAPLQR